MTSERRARHVARYRAALRALPEPERAAYGAHMESMFDDALVDLGGRARVRFVIRAYADLAVQAVSLRLARLGRGGAGAFHAVGQDVRISMRSLARTPGSSVVIVVTLTLGIGLNSSMFSLVNGLLLRPLPYDEPERLVQLGQTAPGFGTMDLSLPDFDTWRAETRVFESMFAFDDGSFLLAGPEATERVEGAVVSPSFLEVLGVATALGRGFHADEEEPGSDGVALLSDRLWGARFGRDPGVVGSTLELSGRSRTVVGIMPPGFHFPEYADVWVPLAFRASEADPLDFGYDAIARLAEGQRLRQAREEGTRIAERIRATAPLKKAGLGTEVYPLRYADVPGGLAVAALVALAAVTLVLLIACANVTSLLLARGERRRAETLTRRALGASRWRIARLVLVESVLLAGVGSVGALAVAMASEDLFRLLLPSQPPFWLHFGLDRAVLGWTLATGVVACLATSVVPALHAVRAGGAGTVRGGRTVVGRGRKGLIFGQVAVAVALVAVAGTTVRALQTLGRVDPGLDPAGVAVLDVYLPPWEYPSPEERREAMALVLEVARAAPGVRHVGAAGTVPFVGTGVEVAIESEDGGGGASTVGIFNAVSRDFFAAIDVPIVEGRVPTRAEERDGLPVAVVSRALAASLWPGRSALGRALRHSAPGTRSPTVEPDRPWLTVIGVAGDVRQDGPGRPSRGVVYVPREQLDAASVTLLAKGEGAPLALAADLRSRLAAEVAGVGFLEATTLDQALGYATWTERLTGALLAAFAALSLGLALAGVHAVVAHATKARARELGVRMALGASAEALRRSVVLETLGLLAPGLAVGLAAGAAIVLTGARYLTWIPPLDPWALAATAAVFAAVAFVATYGPARGIVGGDAVGALRSD